MLNEELQKLATEPTTSAPPTGEDVSFEPEYDFLETEFNKLEGLSDEPMKWGDIIDTCTELLRDRAKDLKVACYLTRALFERDSYIGFANGLGIIKGLVDTYWDNMFPPLKKIRQRAGGLNWLSQKMASTVEKNKPGASSREATKTCFELLKEIEASLDERMQKDAPSFVDLRKALKIHVDEIMREEERIKTEQKKREQAQAAAQQRAEQTQQAGGAENPAEGQTASASVGGASASASVVTSPMPQTSDVGSVGEIPKLAKMAQDPMRQIAIFLRNKKLSDPLPYSLIRISTWMAVTQLPMAQDGVTPLREVPQERVTALKGMLDSGNHHTLIPEVESSFTNAPFWLDAHRLVAASLEALGEEYQAARFAVMDETACFLRRFPGLLDLKFQSGAPFADDLTRMWIKSEVLARGGGDEGESGAGTSSGGQWIATAKKAQGLAGKGKFEDGLKLLRSGIASASGLRERAFWELEQAKFCFNAGHYAVALSQLEYLDDQVEQFRLEDWEPELSLDIARVFLMCHDKLVAKKEPRNEEDMARAAKLKKRVFRLDVATALSLSK